MRFLIDGRQLVFRCASAQPELSATVNGVEYPTGGVYGFFVTLTRLVDEWRPGEVIVCWDSRGPRRRREWFAEYKADHEPKDEIEVEHLEQIETQENVVRLLLQRAGAAQAIAEGWEADDVLATLARGADRAMIYTADSDLLAALSPTVKVLRPIQGREHVETVHTFTSARGFAPDRLPLLKALVGDAREFPGVPGIGVTWGSRIVRQHATLDEVLAAARAGKVGGPDLDGKVHLGKVAADRLVAGEDIARACLKCATLYDVTEDLVWITPRPDKRRLRRHLIRLRCKGITRARPLAALEGLARKRPGEAA